MYPPLSLSLSPFLPPPPLSPPPSLSLSLSLSPHPSLSLSLSLSLSGVHLPPIHASTPASSCIEDSFKSGCEVSIQIVGRDQAKLDEMAQKMDRVSAADGLPTKCVNQDVVSSFTPQRLKLVSIKLQRETL